MRYTKKLLPNGKAATSTLGIGGRAFGYRYRSQATREEAVEIIKQAYVAGVNYFDTSPWYGFNDGCSERPFGEALRGFDRSTYFMATKCGLYDPKTVPFDFRAHVVEANFKKSLEYLQMDYVDMLQLHEFEVMEFEEKYDLLLTETLPALDRLRQQGLIRHIGITSYQLSSLKNLLERSPVKIDTVLGCAKVTLADNEMADYISWFKERNVGVIMTSPLGLCTLASDKSTVAPGLELDPDYEKACDEAREIANKAGMRMERLALGYSIEESERLGIDLVLTGPSTLQQLYENLEIYEDGLTDKERAVCSEIKNGPFGDKKLRQEQRAVFQAMKWWQSVYDTKCQGVIEN